MVRSGKPWCGVLGYGMVWCGMGRFVISGASGMLGGALLRTLLALGEEVEGWSRSIPKTSDGIELRTGDLMDASWAETRLREYRPDVIIHSAALTDADFCEENPQVAKIVNSLTPGRLARIAREIKARFVYISSDSVYDDARPGRRREDERPNPASVYARSKLEGEGYALAAYPEALAIRTTMVGWTDARAPRPKFAEDILGKLTARRQCPLWKDAFFSPLHVDMLGEIILELAEHSDVSGVLNVGARRPISKLDFGYRLAETFGLDPSFIEETRVDDVERPAKRTKNTGLDVKRVEKLLGPMPRVEDGVSQLYQEAHDGTALKIRGRETYP